MTYKRQKRQRRSFIGARNIQEKLVVFFSTLLNIGSTFSIIYIYISLAQSYKFAAPTPCINNDL